MTAEETDEFQIYSSIEPERPEFSSTVELDGVLINKANAVNSLINCRTKLSSERVIRVRSVNDSCLVLNDMTTTEMDSGRIYLGDCLTTVGTMKRTNGMSLVVFSIDKITSHGTNVESIDHELIGDCIFAGSTLKLEVVDESEKHLVWNHEYREKLTAIAGTMCCPTALISDFQSRTEPRYLLELANAATIKQYLSSVYTLTKPKLPQIQEQTTHFHIKLTNSKDQAVVGDGFICNLCKDETLVAQSKMRHHVGKHIINENMSNPHLCGYCGKIGCDIHLKITSGRGATATKGPKSSCPFFYPFKLKPAAVSNNNGPCTNRPVPCTSCQGEVILWSYNLAAHYLVAHPMLTPPEISDDERIRVLKCNY